MLHLSAFSVGYVQLNQRALWQPSLSVSVRPSQPYSWQIFEARHHITHRLYNKNNEEKKNCDPYNSHFALHKCFVISTKWRLWGRRWRQYRITAPSSVAIVNNDFSQRQTHSSSHPMLLHFIFRSDKRLPPLYGRHFFILLLTELPTIEV